MGVVQCEVIEPNNDVDKILYKDFTSGYRKQYVEVGDEKICMPEYYRTIADEVENFDVRDTDIWLTSHPKTGTTWSHEMIWMIVNNLDFEGGQQGIVERIPFLEFCSIFDYRDDCYDEVRGATPDILLKSVDMCRNITEVPRMIKTHMPFSLLPKQIRDKSKKPKIVHIMRNAKDSCVSYYYHCRLLEGYRGNFDDFCKLFLAGRLNWGPFWKNLMGYWEREEEYNILIIKYEDMKKNLASVILKVAEYLGKTITNEQLTILEDHLSFKKMKHNQSVNYEAHCAMMKKLTGVEGSFMRSGTVGSYRADMSDEQIRVFDDWTEENLAGSGLQFDENI